MMNHAFEIVAFALLSIALSARLVDAFVVIVAPPSSVVTRTNHRPAAHASAPSSTTALSAGFGGGSAKEKKEIKLKPKQQWDRYTALKKETSYKVAVKPGNSDEWLEVGAVKSQGGDQTAVAVARQRALIVEHAKRLYPLKISPKVPVEWAYAASDDSWTPVEKSVLGDAPDGIEKMIGFEGKPDPSTGFYCVYNEGRLVSSEEGMAPSAMKPSSKKLQ